MEIGPALCDRQVMRPVVAMLIMLAIVSPQVTAIISSSSTLLGPGPCGLASGLQVI